MQEVGALFCSNGKPLVSSKFGDMTKLAFEKNVWRLCEGKEIRGRDSGGEALAVAQDRDDGGPEGCAERMWGLTRGGE